MATINLQRIVHLVVLEKPNHIIVIWLLYFISLVQEETWFTVLYKFETRPRRERNMVTLFFSRQLTDGPLTDHQMLVEEPVLAVSSSLAW